MPNHHHRRSIALAGIVTVLALLGSLALPGSALAQVPVGRHPAAAAEHRTAPVTAVTRLLETALPAWALPPPAVGASGTHLLLDGQDHTFFGMDAYELGTDWGVNAGCGGMATTAGLDRFFASLPAASLVRVWAFQGTLGTNVDSHRIDWTGLDRVMAAATRYHQYVILALGAQGGGCDGDVWQGPSWYDGGFRQVIDPTGTTPYSYAAYVSAIVMHFRSSPALAMWEPMSEAEASTCPTADVQGACEGGQTCPDETVAAQSLRYFFDHIGARIHRTDPGHLIEDGFLGGGQCGTQGGDWAYVGESPGIDVLSYHDYYGNTPLGGDQWNGIAVRLAQARQVGKPVIAGEMGIYGGRPGPTGLVGGPCDTDTQRASALRTKIGTQVARGASAVLLWNYQVQPQLGACTYDIGPGDPDMAALTSLNAVANGAHR